MPHPTNAITVEFEYTADRQPIGNDSVSLGTDLTAVMKFSTMNRECGW